MLVKEAAAAFGDLVHGKKSILRRWGKNVSRAGRDNDHDRLAINRLARGLPRGAFV